MAHNQVNLTVLTPWYLNSKWESAPYFKQSNNFNNSIYLHINIITFRLPSNWFKNCIKLISHVSIVYLNTVHKRMGLTHIPFKTQYPFKTSIQIDTIRSGCKLFKPFKPIVFLELSMHSLAALALCINIQETLGSPWFKSYLIASPVSIDVLWNYGLVLNSLTLEHNHCPPLFIIFISLLKHRRACFSMVVRCDYGQFIYRVHKRENWYLCRSNLKGPYGAHFPRALAHCI